MRSRPFTLPSACREEFALFVGRAVRRLASAFPPFPVAINRRPVRLTVRVRRTARPAAWANPESRHLLRGLLP